MEEPSSKITTFTRSLNDLPDDILIHILSFLPTTLDAVQTTFLSRKWRYLCRSIPNLSFIQHSFPSSSSSTSIVQTTLNSFVLFITQTLALRNPQSTLLEFRLELYADEAIAHIIDAWIRYAIRFRVTHIELQLPRDILNDDDDDGDSDDDDGDGNDFSPWYCFDLRLLSNSNVKVLKLNECKISVSGSKLENNVLSSTLQSLSLYMVNLTDQMVSEIVMGCVNLEDLVIYRCEDLEDLKIHSTKLKKLSLNCAFVTSVEIFAPNLDLLVLVLFHADEYLFSDVSSLVELRITCATYCYWSKIVRLIGHVQRLTLQNCWFELLLLENALPESFLLYNLNYLELRTGYSKSELLGMAALLERCPNLDTMILINISHPYEEEVLSEEFLNRQITLNIPSLRTAELINYTETENELLLVNHLEEEGVETILLYCTEVGEPSCFPKEKRLTGLLDYSLFDY